jgi:hypothetical protein
MPFPGRIEAVPKGQEVHVIRIPGARSRIAVISGRHSNTQLLRWRTQREPASLNPPCWIKCRPMTPSSNYDVLRGVGLISPNENPIAIAEFIVWRQA